MLEWDVIKIEVAAEIQLAFDRLGEQAANDPTAGQCFWQPAQRTKTLKRRILRVVNEVAPIAMLHRPATRKNARHACGTVTKNRLEPVAIGRERFGERIVLHDFPTARIHHDENGQDVFHSVMIKNV